jgi:hypothetical protein
MFDDMLMGHAAEQSTFSPEPRSRGGSQSLNSNLEIDLLLVAKKNLVDPKKDFMSFR